MKKQRKNVNGFEWRDLLIAALGDDLGTNEPVLLLILRRAHMTSHQAEGGND